MTHAKKPPLVIGVDTGGTFTDFIAITPEGQVHTYKTLSTPHDPGIAVLKGIDVLLEQVGGDSMRVVHGSTVATNAILERKGARTAFVTTEGFGDILYIGRQSRAALYDLTPTPPEPLVGPEHIFEVTERVGVDASIVRPLDPQAVKRVTRALQNDAIESVALLFLHSYANPEHERRVAAALRDAGLWVSVSHEILPEHREYERASTTLLNAYVSPLMQRYLSRLGDAVADRGFESFRVMQSSGGVIDATDAGRFGVRTVLSGPAGGVVGAQRAGVAADTTHLITFDMGGTSTDVALVPGRLQVTTESTVEGFPVRIPVLDIHTVGAGGGSIASIDAGGALRVGPQSAGADPGPACYGRGGTGFTVTDANLLLGRLPEAWFMGGEMSLDRTAAIRAGERLAHQVGVTLDDLAYGVIQVVNSNMERAVKVISVERGHDPRDFTLVSFGGAGSLHACELARSLQIPRVLIPRYPGILSAMGMAVADVVKTYSHALLGPLDTDHMADAAQLGTRLKREAESDLDGEGVSREERTFTLALDLRYRHQSFELTVPCATLLEESAAHLTKRLAEAFHQLHESTYGHAHPTEPVELVAVRLRAEGRVPRPTLPPPLGTQSVPRPSAHQAVYFNRGWRESAIYERDSLGPGAVIEGPAVVVERHATTLIPPDAECTLHPSGALLVNT